MQEHEYALLGGVNRSKIGRYLGIIAAAASAGIVFVLLAAIDLAKRFGVPANLTPEILSLVGAATVFTVLYAFFDRYAWRLMPVAKLLRVPDLAGEWNCEGQTINPDGSPSHTWQATVTIVQSWDRLRIRLRTSQSGSNSIAAALMCDKADGYQLLYNYRNEPKIGEPELKAHQGFAQLMFAKDLASADGEYFNGHGRFTFGTMKLTRA